MQSLASPAAAASHPDGLPAPERYWSMAVIILGIALTVLDSSMVNLALPAIARDLHAAPSDSILVVNAYQIGALALLLPCAALGDRLGYRQVYLAGMVVYTAGALCSVLSPTLPLLIASRTVQGIGAAGVMAVNPALVRLTFPMRLLGRGIAVNSVTVATASVAGPTVSAAVLSLASWHWLFAISVPAGLFMLALGARALPHNPPRSHAPSPLRPLDVVLNMLFFGAMFLGFNLLGGSGSHSTHGVSPQAALGLLGAGLAIGAWYLQRQWHEATPLLPVDLLRIRIFALSMLTSISAFGAQVLTFIALPFLMLDVWHLSALEAGLLISAWPCGVVCAAPLAGVLIGRFRTGTLAGVGLAVLCAGLVSLALMSGEPSSWSVAARLLVCGAGFGMFQPPNNHAIVTSAPLHRSGAASGMLATARITGQTIGAVFVAMVFSLIGTAGGGGPRIAIACAAFSAAASSVFSIARARHQQAPA